jgi:L-lactate dehydrogenase complex protein LldG
MLKEIREANRRGGVGVASEAAADAAWGEIPRGYTRVGLKDAEARLELLEDRLRDYDAHVVRVGVDEIAGMVGAMLRERGKRRLVVPAGMADGVLPDGFEFVVDDGLSAVEIDGFDGVVSESTLAIAETGTLVLQSVAGQGRRVLSLVPDYHLCLVQASEVVETVPEAMDWIRRRPAFATTFISGPSATADIEMTRIKGVHGPRFLDVIVVTDVG